MHRTRPFDLAVPFIIIGITGYALLRFSYADFPPLRYFVPVPLAALAIAELVAARRVRAAIRHHPHARPMAAIVIARCVALGKASSVVGAGVAGAATALLVRVLPDAGQVRAAAHDAQVGGLALGATVLLVIAGLALERAGIDPGRGKETDTGSED